MRDTDTVLVVNAGSSSLKLSLLDAGDRLLAGRELPAPRATIEPDTVHAALRALGAPDAVGHRIVHGGTEFSSPVIVDKEVVDRLSALTQLAPLHQPKSLAALRVVSDALPGVPAVACFDTAFHSTLPAAAATYALPAAWRKRFSIRRYGFHGLSHAYASRRAAALLGHQPSRLVSCHLGAGASLAAVRDGISVDTTMGFTPLEGLVMASRSGSVDPGLVLWLLGRGGLSVAAVADGLEHDSGLAGLTGTPDMREVLARSDPDAELALDVYVHRLCAEVAAMAAALGGVDALVFTGGVGERSPPVRARAARGLAFLGVALDEERNATLAGDGEIGAGGVHVVVVEAREDLEIARQVRATLQ